MVINDQIIEEKLQYDVNREAAKISALFSGKTNKYEYRKRQIYFDKSIFLFS